MRAVLMTAVGGPEVLELRELPEPEPSGEHDVRVHLRAAVINPVDYKLRSYGTFARSLPVILGLRWGRGGGGHGPPRTRVRPGDEVYFCDGGLGPAGSVSAASTAGKLASARAASSSSVSSWTGCGM